MPTRLRLRLRSATLGPALTIVALSPALPGSARTISPTNPEALTNRINRPKNLSYLATYISVNGGQTTTVSIAQSPPKSNFSTSTGSVINDGKKTYY